MLLPVICRTCAGCKREIGYGNYLGCMGTFYHPECFRCRACSYPITEHEFSLSGRDTYHKSCFKELTHPKCEVCHQFIPTNGVGLIEYRCHPFWSQKYCPSHEHDNTARCCSCERLEGFHHMPETRGLCLSEEQTVTSILKRPRMERRGLDRNQNTTPKANPELTITGRILRVFGLLTGAILAHELMHGWLRLNGYRNLRPEVEEGICQILSYMWLESEVIPGTRSMPSTSTASSSSTWSYGSTSTASSSSSWSASKKGGRSSVENKLGEFSCIRLLMMLPRLTEEDTELQWQQ
ncbi:UNVERIFIED_CONTAM: protein DA1-related 2 [Sesamum angustifolium]|uniref:Protein DA1-related 2 n=1 Tax=Sesamum angustifolium TaxID=2727405 RepID=A0AAW2LCP0_9LAMI